MPPMGVSRLQFWNRLQEPGAQFNSFLTLSQILLRTPFPMGPVGALMTAESVLTRTSQRDPGSGGTVEYNLADLFESVVDAVPDREALVYVDHPGTGEEQPAHLRRARRRRQPDRPPPPRLGRPARRTSRPPPLQRGRVPADRPRLPQGADRAGERELPVRGGGARLPLPGRRPGRARLRRRVHRPGRGGAAADGEAAAPRAGGDPARGSRRPRLRPVPGGGGHRIARARLRPPLGRRPLHHLHRRYDRDAQGRAVAPGGPVLRGTLRRGSLGRGGEAPRGARRAGRGRGQPASPSSPRRRSCTARPR